MIVYKLECITESRLFVGDNVIHKEKPPFKPFMKSDDGHCMFNIHGWMRAYLEQSLREEGVKVCDSSKDTCGECVLCKLFGSKHNRGVVYFTPMRSVEPAENITKIVVHPRVDRETGKTKELVKLEVVKEGAVFRGEITLLDDRYESIVDKGLDLIERWGVGGWRRRGYGKIRWTKREKERL